MSKHISENWEQSSFYINLWKKIFNFTFIITFITTVNIFYLNSNFYLINLIYILFVGITRLQTSYRCYA